MTILLLLVGAICGIATAEVVRFPDPALDTAIREAIGRTSGSIYRYHLEDLEVLDAHDLGIIDLEGLQFCVGLVELDVRGNEIVDLGPLSALAQLSILSLSGNPIQDLSPLSTMTDLSLLRLEDCQIADLAPLADLAAGQTGETPHLETLELDRNRIDNLEPLSGLNRLRRLTLSGNQVADISPLGNLTRLAFLNLNDNLIQDIAALASLIELKILLLDGNLVTDISALSGMIDLIGLWLNDNQITDLEPLSENPGIDFLDRVYICGNPASTVEGSPGDEVVQALTRRGVYLYDCP